MANTKMPVSGREEEHRTAFLPLWSYGATMHYRTINNRIEEMRNDTIP